MTRAHDIFSATAFGPSKRSAQTPADTGMGVGNDRPEACRETNLTALAARSALR